MKMAIDHTVWASRLTPKYMDVSLRLLRPSAGDKAITRAITVSNGDMRQAQLQLDVSGNGVDKSSHLYFDVNDALCRGAKKDLGYRERNCVSESIVN